jgi:hypothetical protein
MGVFFRALLNGTGDQGVLRGWLNELEVTDGGVDTADVDTGGAILYGIWHQSDAVENININAYRGGNCLIVVRASWAAQTARIVARAVGALTQTPGVTYEIPLANVAINGAGAITLITDTRDFCEFSTEMLPNAVTEDAIQADAVTTAKVLDVTRWVTRGLYQFKADATNPATISYSGNSITTGAWIPYKTYWSFTDGVSDRVWCTFQVPADIASATVEVFLWSERAPGYTSAATAMRWAWSSWDAGAGAVLVNQTGAATVNYADRIGAALARGPVYGWVFAYYNQHWRYSQRDSLGTITVNAGDIVHFELWRDGAHAADTFAGEGAMFMVEFAYTADS